LALLADEGSVVVERHDDRWLAGLVAELRSAARSDDLGRLIVEAACRAAECDGARLILPAGDGEPRD